MLSALLIYTQALNIIMKSLESSGIVFEFKRSEHMFCWSLRLAKSPVSRLSGRPQSVMNPAFSESAS